MIGTFQVPIMGHRKSHIEKALLFLELAEKGPFTAGQVQRALGVCRTNAYRWIKDASLVVPIYESGKIEKFGRPRTVFKILGD